MMTASRSHLKRGQDKTLKLTKMLSSLESTAQVKQERAIDFVEHLTEGKQNRARHLEQQSWKWREMPEPVA